MLRGHALPGQAKSAMRIGWVDCQVRDMRTGGDFQDISLIAYCQYRALPKARLEYPGL